MSIHEQFTRTYTCDRCGRSKAFYDGEEYIPYEWAYVLLYDAERTEKHFCSKCASKLFGEDGKAYELDPIRDEYHGSIKYGLCDDVKYSILVPGWSGSIPVSENGVTLIAKPVASGMYDDPEAAGREDGDEEADRRELMKNYKFGD